MNKKYEPQEKWQKENTDSILIKPNKRIKWPERIARAVAMGKAASRQGYIIAAVERALIDDGITIDDVSDTE